MTPSAQSKRRKQRRSGSGLARLILAALALACLLVLWAVLVRVLAPTGNTQTERFDAILVLGYPSDSDGNPTPEQLARVSEAVKEYQRGVAPRLIVSGAAAHNGFVEADSMARVARAQGVPAGAIIEETQALDTIQNACYSARIMKQHGWKSAEVISSQYHLPRAGVIFSHLPAELAINWRSHAAPGLEPGSDNPGWAVTVAEIVKTTRYLIYAQWAETCSP